MYFSRRRSLMTMATAALLLGTALPSSAADETAIDQAAVDDASAVTEVLQVEETTPAYETPDYEPMQVFMERVSTNQRGRPAVRFKQLRDLDLSFFDAYEEYLVGIDSDSLSADDRLAYWLNLQNFLVVKAVTYDTKKTNLKSLRGTGSKPGKMWTKDRVTIGGETYSIADIEAKVIAENNNPDVIYGLYQGVKGGPCLSNTPYEGESVKARLAELGEQYVNSRGIVEPNKSVVTLAPVYEWHKTALFAGNDKEVFAHVKNYASTNLRGRLNRATQVKYSKLNYSTDHFEPQKQAGPPQAKRQRQAPPPSVPRTSGGGGYGS